MDFSRFSKSFLGLLGVSTVAASSLFGFSFTASAAVSGGVWLTPEQTLALYGDEISATYYNGSDYVDTTFSFVSSQTGGSFGYSDDLDGYLSGNTQWLLYEASITGLNTNPDYVTFTLHPSVTFTGCYKIYMACGIASNSVISNTVYSPPELEVNLNGQQSVLHGNISSNTFENLFFSVSRVYWHGYLVPFSYSSQTEFYFSSVRYRAFGCTGNSGKIYMVICCPYVSDGTEWMQGTYPTGTGGGSEGTGDYDSQLQSIIAILNQIAANQGYTPPAGDGDSEGVGNIQTAVSAVNGIIDDNKTAQSDLWVVDGTDYQLSNVVSDLPIIVPDTDDEDSPFLPWDMFISVFDFDESLSPILPMALITLSISTLSYIVFGKLS